MSLTESVRQRLHVHWCGSRLIKKVGGVPLTVGIQRRFGRSCKSLANRRFAMEPAVRLSEGGRRPIRSLPLTPDPANISYRLAPGTRLGPYEVAAAPLFAQTV